MKIPFRLTVVFIFFIFPAYLHSDDVILPVLRDTFVTQARRDANFGDHPRFMNLGLLGRMEERVFVGGIPVQLLERAEPIEQAVLRLYCPSVGTRTQKIELFRVAESWDENEISYTDQPRLEATGIGFSLNDAKGLIPEGRGAWYEIDITPVFNQWLTGAENYGLALVPVNTGTGVDAELSVRDVGRATAPRVIVRDSGLLAADYLDWDGTTAMEPVAAPDGIMICLYPSQDSWVNALSGRTATNYGAGRAWVENGAEGEPALFLGFLGRARASVLIQGFDLSRLPDDIPILRAELKLYMVYSGSAHEVEVTARRITEAWSELAVTQEKLPAFSSESYGRAVLEGAINMDQKNRGEGRWISWDITELARLWKNDPAANFGLLLHPEGDSGVDRQFDCRESECDFGPRLEIIVPPDAGFEASPPAPLKRPPVVRGRAEYPAVYRSSQADIDALKLALSEVQGRNPYIDYYRKPETGEKIDLGELKATESDVRSLDAITELLREKDPEGLWLLTRVASYRPEILLVFLRTGDTLFDTVETVLHELTHAGSGSMTPFIQEQFFKGKALTLNYPAYRGYSFLIDNECVGIVLPRQFFARDQILQYIPDGEFTGMASAYLTGASGAQDLMTLLDEINAYTRGLRGNLALASLMPDDRDLAWRLLQVLYFTELYFRHAQERETDQYRTLCECPELAMIIGRLFSNARSEIENIPNQSCTETFMFQRMEQNLHYIDRYLNDAAAPSIGDRPFSHLPLTDQLRQRCVIVY